MRNELTSLGSGKVSRVLIGAVMVSIGLAGCSSKHEDKKQATQVAAKVNGSEISVHQINQVLSRTPGVTQENAVLARKEILEKLISQQIAVDKAIETKVDRSPEVMMALEAARREVLTNAYLTQIGTAAAKVGDDEARKYFNEHPELFSNRRVYNLQDIALPRDDKSVTGLRSLVAQGKSMQDIAGWLKGNNVKFGANAETRAAEQLPLELLPKIAQMADGQTALIEMGPALHVVHLVSSQQASVGEAEALPRIKQFLGNKRGQEAIAADMKKLRDAAKVEYLGEFSGAKSQQPTVSAPAADVKPAEVDKQKPAAVNESVKKGAAGL